jgi:hypothetical protein
MANAVKYVPSSAGINILESSIQEGIVKLDKSPPQIRNSEISNWTACECAPCELTPPRFCVSNLGFRDFGFEVGFCPISRFPTLRLGE